MNKAAVENQVKYLVEKRFPLYKKVLDGKKYEYGNEELQCSLCTMAKEEALKNENDMCCNCVLSFSIWITCNDHDSLAGRIGLYDKNDSTYVEPWLKEMVTRCNIMLKKVEARWECIYNPKTYEVSARCVSTKLSAVWDTKFGLYKGWLVL